MASPTGLQMECLMRVRGQLRRLSFVAATVATAILLMLVSALPAWAADAMTLTFVRHGESEANATASSSSQQAAA